MYIAFGYWMASSKQLNSNDYLNNYLMTTGSVFQSDHIMTDVLKPSGWSGLGFAMIFTFVAIIFLYFAGGLVMEKMSEKISWIKIGDIQLDEEIDNYWNCLDEEDRLWAIKEEEYAHEVLNMPIMLSESFQKLKAAQQKKQSLEGCHTYDILANPLYIEQFQYVAAATEDRNNYIFDDDANEGNDAAQSDFVRVVLNLGYMHNPEDFDFLPSNLLKLKEQHDKLHDQEKGHALN